MLPKRGFNLIEIAIVLAVIGLVTGGIYTAASAVTENNRRMAIQKQVIQIVTNVRAAYATQPRFTEPTYAQAKAMKLYPGDLADTGSTFLNAYGGPVAVVAGTALTDQEFDVRYYGLPKAACIDYFSKSFGSAATIGQLGIIRMGTDVGGELSAAQLQDGVQLQEALAICTGVVNQAGIIFNIRG